MTVSIVSGTDAEDLRGALGSLPAGAARTPCRIVVIDNLAPFDISAAVSAARCAAEVVRNDVRRGFGANHNRVLSRLETPYALVMNDDVVLGEGCIDRLVDFMERTNDAGAAGCALYSGSWTRSAIEAGGAVDGVSPALKLLAAVAAHRLGAPTGLEGLVRWNDRSPAPPDRSRRLDYVSGACCLLRARALQAVGTYDARYYMYLEDVDLGRRLGGGGWRCYQVPGARVLHRGRRSWTPRTTRWMWESARYYADKYDEPLTRLAARALEALAGPRR